MNIIGNDALERIFLYATIEIKTDKNHMVLTHHTQYACFIKLVSKYWRCLFEMNLRRWFDVNKIDFTSFDNSGILGLRDFFAKLAAGHNNPRKIE
jgi:hypothetical protein